MAMRVTYPIEGWYAFLNNLHTIFGDGAEITFDHRRLVTARGNGIVGVYGLEGDFGLSVDELRAQAFIDRTGGPNAKQPV